MQAITLKNAERNLQRLVDQVLADAEPQIVVTEKGGQVVIVPLDDFNSLRERVYLAFRAARADEKNFREALDAIPDVEAAEHDRL